MVLSKETLNIIRNFGTINGSLNLKAGKRISTISEGNTVLAEATVEDEFPIDFSVYDVAELLSSISVFKTPDISFNEKYLVISEGSSKIKFFAAGPGIVRDPPASIKFPEPEVSFLLTETNLASIVKTSGILKAADVGIVGRDGTLYAEVVDKKNPTSNSFTLELGDCDITLSAMLRVENLKMIPGEYQVAISSKKISRFVNTNGSYVTYYVAIEADSKFA
jgi:hypothetical protein